MMSFSHPAMLWALTSLAIPLAIHLLSRKEGKVIRMGSIRHIEETSTRQFRGIRLNEILLLALRSLIVIIAVSLLAGLRWTGSRNQQWVLVEPGLENNTMIKPVLDSLQQQGFEWHSLAPGFPTTPSTDSSRLLPYASLLHDLKAQSLQKAIVFSYNRVSLSGTSQVLPSYIQWIGVPAPPSEFILTRVQHTPDSMAIRIGYASSRETRFTTAIQPGIAQKADVPPVITIALVYEAAYDYDATIVRASLSTLERSLPVTFVIKDKLQPDETYDWCIALGPAVDLPKSKRILRLAGRVGQPLLVQAGPGRWEITKRLNPEIALQDNLIVHLAHVMIPEEKYQAIARKNDRRMMPDQMLWSPASESDFALDVQEPATTYLWIILIALLIVERFVAYQRNQ